MPTPFIWSSNPSSTDCWCFCVLDHAKLRQPLKLSECHLHCSDSKPKQWRNYWATISYHCCHWACSSDKPICTNNQRINQNRLHLLSLSWLLYPNDPTDQLYYFLDSSERLYLNFNAATVDHSTWSAIRIKLVKFFCFDSEYNINPKCVL